MTEELPRPPRCQSPAGRCSLPPAVVITYQTAPLTGRMAAPGTTFKEAYCRADARQRVAAIHQAGGRVVSEEDLPALPEPLQPEPVGLDAIAPTGPSS